MAEIKLDRIDIKILAELQKNGRITNVILSDKVGLSPSPCLKRVKRLEQAGYVSGYGAFINLAKLGSSVTVFTQFTLSQHHQYDFDTFERLLSNCAEVTECHMISGGFDYLVKFTVKSIEHYQDVIDSLLKDKKMVKEYFSYIVIRSPIKSRSIALEKIYS
ncbi:MAG: Lrp/AsnC family transcriptional regulator [Emcibacteraceae bacterium]